MRSLYLLALPLALFSWIYPSREQLPVSSDSRYLVHAIDWSRSELEVGRTLLEEGDTNGALDFLLLQHKKLDRDWLASTWDSISAEATVLTADALLRDTVFLYNMRCKVPSRAGGGWQWDYTGPVPDDEFGYSLNGHKYLRSLYDQYQISGDGKYAIKLLEIMEDWIISHPLPQIGDSVYLVYDPAVDLDYRDFGEVEWRTLEIGHRLGSSWPQIYYGLVKNDLFDRDLRIKILASLAQQSDLLQEYHKRGHNWTTMEMNGLALVALSFPDFKRSETWRDYALQTMEAEISNQVYPDGAQVELAAKTQWVALERFESIAQNYASAGQVLDANYRSRIEQMYNYMAYSMRPDGYQPLNSDADREDLTVYINTAAVKYDRPDWLWITSNGQRGERPKLAPTQVFPWAGVGIFRSGWDADAQWLFFDGGPYGIGHQHRDKLHLSLSAFGHDLLVDGGRYTHENYFSFDPKEWRGYFRSSHSHNVMLVNGAGQQAYDTRASVPINDGVDYLISDKFSVIRASFEDGFEQVEFDVEHRRSVYHLLYKFVVVIDEVTTGEPCDIDFLWHLHPRVSLDKTKYGLVAVAGRTRLHLLHSDSSALVIDQIRGQKEPTIQGWYSETYGKKEENLTLNFSRRINGMTKQAWLFFPSQEDEKELSWSVEFTVSHCHINVEGAESHQWKLPLYDQDLTTTTVK